MEKEHHSKYSDVARKVVENKWFTIIIMFLIVLNGLLIGVQTYDNAPDYIQVIQLCILFVFFFEIIIRWTGRKSTHDYVSNWWNWFDICILIIGVIPEVADIMLESTQEQKNIMSILRILRVVQLTRSIRAIPELQLLIGVLIKSIRSLSYIAVLFLLIMYIYAIIGVTLFKNPDYPKSEHLALTTSNPDPYGNLGEAFFTLFRIMTGEDWTDLRYNLIEHEYTTGTVPVAANWVITFFHVSWMVTSAYLLINLVIGAIVNNFQLVLTAQKEAEEKLLNGRKDDDDNSDDNEDDESSSPEGRRHFKRPKV